MVSSFKNKTQYTRTAQDRSYVETTMYLSIILDVPRRLYKVLLLARVLSRAQFRMHRRLLNP